MVFSLAELAVKPSALLKPQLIMAMGPFGSGKTYFAASASEIDELSPMAYIDVEGSTVGTITNFKDRDIDIYNLPAIQAQSVDEDGNPVHLFEVFDQIVTALLEQDHEYKTVVIDTLDGLNGPATDYFNDPQNSYAKWASLHEYFTANGGLIDRLQQAPFLAILVMHETYDEESKTFNFSWPGTTSRNALGKFPQLILRLNRKYNERKNEWVTSVITAPTDKGQAKSRFGQIPPVIEGKDVTMTTIWDMINDTKKGKN